MPPPPSSRNTLDRTLVPAPSAALPITKSANTEQAILDALARLGPGTGGTRALLEAPTAGPGTAVPGEGLLDPHATVSGDVVVTAVRRLPAAPAMFAPMPEGLDGRLVGALATRGIRELYTHQAETMAHALAGRSAVVVTPTASGKTLCFNGPVLDAILKDTSTRALYLYPTKALAQDQLAELHGLVELIDTQAAGVDSDGPEAAGARAATPPSIGVFTYDGDTPQDARRAVRGRAHIVLSNPDMLHAGILPHHPRWAKLFENLRFVVIDELHAYRGVFGSHLANILRRLRRVCRHYGSSPVFICTSATIANPVNLAERLTETPMALVDRSGAPRAEKFFAFVNPPVVNSQLGIRRSYLAETRRVTLEFLRRHLQVIVFAQSRLATEILTTYLKEDCQGPPGAPEMVRGYRGGYLPLRRREIERGLREGTVRAVVSTSALELGIDIGALDASIMAGYPGTIAATWQRAGRAGRRAGRSAAVLVASSAPLDQFIVRHPDYFFGASPEQALVNPDNLQILLDHIKCAAFELPFQEKERFGEEDLEAVLGLLGEEGFVHQADGQWNWTHESYPADAVSLRSVSSDNVVVVDVTVDPQVIAETDFTSAPSMLHEKAIYILEGQLFHVERFDFDHRKAYVKRVDCDYYTDAIKYSKVTILDERSRPVADDAVARRAVPIPGAHGEVHVVARVIGFKKIRFYTNENVGSGELDLPEQQMHTTSYWLTVPKDLLASLPYDSEAKRDGVSGMAQAMRTIAQLLLMCDRNDLGVSVNAEGDPGTGAAPVDPGAVPRESGPRGAEASAEAPRIFIYDNYPGGIGFSGPLFEVQDRLLEASADLIASCECERGCPSCVGPIGEIGPRGKRVALDLLERLTGRVAVAAVARPAIDDGEVPF
ncbi:MAG: DEAD/DEAH box helicase [Vicinamibacteraceae bacterium]